ncbi:MAG: tail fiber domain-containing protein [Vicinamibacterales bacterium]
MSVLLGSPVFAQSPTPSASVPRVVRLDGQLTPANGLPPAAVETVTLSIYASQTDETPLWAETQEVRVDGQGRYAVFLGASTAAGIPASVLSGEARWLGIRFARPGEVEQPRVPMTSVPYALRASDADTLGGLPPSAFFRVPGATAKGSASGANAANRATAPLVSTGTANFIGKFTNSIDLTNSVLFENAGRIGLNTTSPLDLLHSRFTDTTGGLTGIAVQNLGSSATSYSGMLFYDQNGALGQFQGFNNSTHEYRINNIASGGTINFMIGGTSRFLVRNDGDIEVGGSLRKSTGEYWAHAGGSGVSFGVNAGFSGLQNSAFGTAALQVVTPLASNNAAVGFVSLAHVTDGDNNTAIGAGSGFALTTGVDNTALGFEALHGAVTSSDSVAVGKRALYTAQTSDNVAVGFEALRDSTGNSNIALGAAAAQAKVTGSGNMYLGANVANSAANVESNTIRVGEPGGLYTRFIAGGVRGVTTGAADAVTVVIDSNGQLGTVNSSRRYKEDIQDMGEASSRLMQLRPVTYRYTQAYADGSKPIDYGLIAEEVEQVYPDLVAHLKNGEVETVQYHKINAMLLNEVQKQHRQIGEQQSVMDAQQRELTDLKARLAAIERLLVTEKK